LDTLLVYAGEGVVEAIKGVAIKNHASGAVNESEVVAEQFLANPANLMDVAGIIKKFLHGVAVANPVKVSAPQPTPIVTNGPTTTTSLAHERVKECFAVGASAGTHADRAEAGTGHQEFKDVVAASFKNS